MSASTAGDVSSPPPGAKPRRGRRWLVAALLALALGLAHRPLLVGYARQFRIDDRAPSDALVLLSDSPEATELYRRGLAPLLLTVSAAPFPFPDLNPAEVGRRILVRQGIPADSIRVVTSDIPFPDERQVAHAIARYARSHALRRITVVAGSAQTGHLRRVYRRALRGTGVDVRLAAVPNPWYHEASWYTTDEGLVDYFNETIQWFLDLFCG